MSDYEFQPPKIEKQPGQQSGFNLSALAVRERPVTLFFLLATILAGVFAYLQLGRAEDPTFTIKVFTVIVAWPGATAQQMQDLVAEPLEKRMQELQYYHQRGHLYQAGASGLGCDPSGHHPSQGGS
jgi:Cu/Ag efflux pump CusA